MRWHSVNKSRSVGAAAPTNVNGKKVPCLPPTLGLYIHIPFCKSKCIYCDFYSLAGAEEAMDRYVSALIRQLEELAPRCRANPVDTVYFGGGTPSYLGVKRLKKILKAVFHGYQVTKDPEITLEANPDSLADKRTVSALRRAGINRISLGVQSADDGELRTIGRVHTFAQAEAAVEAVRRGKIGNLSLDLIYGLPGQSLESWQSTVEKILALEPEHLSCYGLKVEEGTPLWQRQGELELPDDDLQADMYLWAAQRLTAAGYEHYEISNFAKPGRQSRHNMKYWTLQPYAGFGPGAHSDFGDVRYAWVRDLETFCRGVETGESVLAESERIPPRDRDTEYLMLGLRTARGIGRREFENRFRLPFAPIASALEPFRARGWAVEEDGRWRLTAEGFLLSNQIILSALEALGREKERRQRAAQNHDFRVTG